MPVESLPAIARTAAVAIAIFYLPGRVVLAALGLSVAWPERLGLSLVLSLALMMPALAVPYLVGGSLSLAVGVLAATVGLAGIAAVRQRSQGRASRRPGAGESRGAVAPLAIGLAAGLTVAAVWLTGTGSIDRWWYLGYVRALVEQPVVSAAEPFLGTGNVLARFAFNTWIGAMALWSHLAAVEPAWLYERACPALLMPATFSAAYLFARGLLGSATSAWLATLYTGLLLSGGSRIFVLARLPEDKVLATVVIVPVLWAAVVHAQRSSSERGRWLLLAIGAAIALATTHPLVYAMASLAIAPFLLAEGVVERSARGSLAAIALVLAIGAVWPVATGAAAREALETDGALAADSGHPVARVHAARERLLDVGEDRYIVHPRLLLHPLVIFAIVSLPLAVRRPREQRSFLLCTTLVPLAIAFVSPLATLMGDLVSPWMVYRVLWMIPFAPLAAVGIEELALLLRTRTLPIVAALAAAVAPWVIHAVGERTEESRMELAVPRSGELPDLVAAVRALPEEALVAAAPSLADRLPGLTGRTMLAMSDRPTVVFAGSRDSGEQRLRARALVFSGTWQPLPGTPVPTHLIAKPAAQALRYCGERLLDDRRYVLCTFLPRTPEPALPLQRAAADVADGNHRATVADGSTAPLECQPPPDARQPFARWQRPPPWSAAVVAPVCRLSASHGRLLRARTITVMPILVRATDELELTVRGKRFGRTLWVTRGARRFDREERVRFVLPTEPVEEIEIALAPRFLPFLKLRELAVTFEDQSAAVSKSENEKPIHSRSMPFISSKTSASISR